MNTSANSISAMRLQAITNLINEGESTQYAASIYGVDKAIVVKHLAGLSGRIHSNTVENNIEPPSFTKEYESIFPYIIMLQGNFVDGFKYFLIGNGTNWSYDSYDHAHREALGWLEFDSLDEMMGWPK